jgi:hypothetical protein
MAVREPYDVGRFVLELIASAVFALGGLTAFFIDGGDVKRLGFKAIGVAMFVGAFINARRAFATRKAGPRDDQG